MYKKPLINSYKNVPEIDQRYIQDLQEKDRIVRERIEKRNKLQEEERHLVIQKATKTLEYLTNHKKDMQKRNAVFQNDMRSHVERFHREIAKVYVADENLRQTKTVIENYLRNFRPQVAVQLKNVLSNNNYSLEAKIFNVKNHAPIILSKNNELIRLEQKQRELEEEITKEELKQDIVQAKQNIQQQHVKQDIAQQLVAPQYAKQDIYNKPNQSLNSSQPSENRELIATQKINQPSQQQLYKHKEQIKEDDELQRFDQDDSMDDMEDNYATQKNKHNQYAPDMNRPSANPNFTQKNPNQNTQGSQQSFNNIKGNNETKKRVNNIFDEEVHNDFDD